MMYRIAAGIAVVALAGGPALARQAWDQAAVNSLASDLAATTRALKESLLAEPQIAQDVQMGDPDVVGLLESIGALAKSARQLSRALGDSKGYETTLPMATLIRSLARDAEQYGAGIGTTARMQEKMEPVEDLLGKLTPYYFD